MVRIDWNCPCGLKIKIVEKAEEFESKCPCCERKLIRRFNPKTENYEITILEYHERR